MKEDAVTPAALQRRSVVTHDRLCDAAEGLLREGGLARCTIQDVAAHSGRSAGSVYRRFGDKDGMLKAVIERYLQRTLAANESNLRLLASLYPDLNSRLKALVEGAVAGRRRDWKLIEAFREAARDSSNASLSEAFERTRLATLDLAKRALRECAGEISHPDTGRAIDCGVAMLAGTIDALVREPAAIPDDVLCVELRRMLSGYFTISRLNAGN